MLPFHILFSQGAVCELKRLAHFHLCKRGFPLDSVDPVSKGIKGPQSLPIIRGDLRHNSMGNEKNKGME